MRAPRRRACAVCAYVLALAAPAGCGSDDAAPAVEQSTARQSEASGSARTQRLSDERRVTRYANAVTRAAVRAAPRPEAQPVGRLRYRTEDGPLETYLALELRVDDTGRQWIHIRLPGRPNGRTGWVRRADLGPLVTVRTLLRVDRRELRATLYERGRRIWSSRVAVGRPSTPTPAGHFWIRSRLKGLGDGTVYGPWAFGTAAYSNLSDWPGGGVVGIHGTNRPDLIPGRPSHGCIRVPNAAVRRLARILPIGTPVHIV